ncbi:MAG: hypothetical protein ACE37K_18485 [Planctomycetota bacterium]
MSRSQRSRSLRGRSLRGRALRRASWLPLAVLAACGAGTEGTAELEQRLLAAAERMAVAFTTMDLDAQVELTHPSVVRQLGGEQGYRRVLERGKASLAKVEPPKGRITGVDGLVVRGESAFAFVRIELEMTNQSGERGVVDSYFAAESPADGSSWKFLDGSGLQGSLALLRKAIPAWPDELPPPQTAGTFRKL